MTVLLLLVLPYLAPQPSVYIPGDGLRADGMATWHRAIEFRDDDRLSGIRPSGRADGPTDDHYPPNAQSSGDQAFSDKASGDQASGQPDGIQWHPAVVMGTRGFGSDAHLFGGLTLGVHRGDFGGGATFHVGGGNDYRSILTGMGPSWRIQSVAGMDLSSWIGVGYLSERLFDDRAPGGTEAASRTLTGAMATLSIRRPLQVGALTAQVLFLAGQSDGADFVRTPWVSTTRFTVGFGW